MPPDTLQVHTNACLDSAEAPRPNTAGCFEQSGADASPDDDDDDDEVQFVSFEPASRGAASGSRQEPLSPSQSRSPPAKKPRPQASEYMPAPLTIPAYLRVTGDSVGMDVLTNVTGRMAAQYTIAKVKHVAGFHISSRFDLSSTTQSGNGWDCGFRNTQMVCEEL